MSETMHEQDAGADRHFFVKDGKYWVCECGLSRDKYGVDHEHTWYMAMSPNGSSDAWVCTSFGCGVRRLAVRTAVE